MNSPLPKPTPPSNDDKQKQNVVFDGKKQTSTSSTAGDQARVPLTQKESPAPKPTLPPTSLSALSSMNSNKIPTSNPPVAQTSAPQKTVLGQPIPQAIRGEAPPQAFGKPAPSKPLPGAVTTKSSPAPGKIKKEDPSIKEGKKNPPKIATVRSPIMKFLPFIVGGIVLLVLIVVVLSKFLGGGSTSVSDNQVKTAPAQPSKTQSQNQPLKRTAVPSKVVTIDYWGLWEPQEVMQEVISDFEKDNPGIKVNYVKQSPVDYRERLQTAIKSGNGPDIFRFHASWVPMLKNLLDPIPASVVTASEFKKNYYPVVTQQLVSNGQYLGLPIMYDGLVLYYNKDILETADEKPPTTWTELRSLAVKLTVPSASGIERGGLAIGNATNVDHFSDILATLILQNGGDLSDATTVETRDALLFYTNFQLTDKVWSETLPSSTVAFARGDVAMMFAPSWRIHEIKALNPDLKFATAPMPQLSEDEKITWASYWVEGLSAKSPKLKEATTFLEYLTKSEVLKKLYSAETKTRAFGELYPKVDMAQDLAENTLVAPVLEDAPYAQSGYLNSFTHDNGINDQMIEYYKKAIDAIVAGQDVDNVQASLDKGIKQVLKQYGVSTR